MIDSINDRSHPARPTLHLLLPPAIMLICILLALVGTYNLPLSIWYDIGRERHTFVGLYRDEHNAHFSYAYTDGNAVVQLPQVGNGLFLFSLRIGAPQEIAPVEAHLRAAARRIDLGPIGSIRTYHMLVPSDINGNLQVAIESPTARVGVDQRRLGVLLDWFQARSYGVVFPPPAVVLAVFLAMGLSWLLLAQIKIAHTWRRALLAAILAAMCAVALRSRGYVAIQPWWFMAADGFVLAVLGLSWFDGRWSLKPLYAITSIFLCWRISLWMIAVAALYYQASISPIARVLSVGGTSADIHNLLWSGLVDGWTYWDGGHYRSIVRSGYTFPGARWPTIAFFPLYPLLIRAAQPLVGGNISVASLLVSNAALFIALWLLYDLLKRDFSSPVAYRTIILLLLFPTSFFLGATFTESLALMLLAAVVWALRRERWWLAGAAGVFLALTRPPGVMAAPLILLAYLHARGWRWRALRWDALACAGPCLGLGMFMLYQWPRAGSPFAFIIAERAWGQRFTWPWEVPPLLLGAIETSPYPLMALAQALIWFGFLLLLALVFWRLPLVYGLTTLLLMLPLYLTDQVQSLPRYVLLGFPVFVVVGLAADRLWVRRLIVALMLPLLMVAVSLFVNAFWVG